MKHFRKEDFARGIIAVALLTWLMTSVNLHEVVGILRRCEWQWVAAGLSAFAVATLVVTIRLRVLFQGLNLTFASAGRFTLASYLFNQVLPTGIGGDAYRSLVLKKVSGTWGTAVGLLAFERMVGALGLLLPALAYAILRYGPSQILHKAQQYLPHSETAVRFGAAILLLITLSLILIARVFTLRRRIRSEALNVIRHLSSEKIVSVFAISILHHALRVCGTWFFLASIGRHLAFFDVTIVMALALFASLVPLSIGAIGVREGVLVFGFAAFGVPKAEGFAVAILNRMVVVILGLAGALVLSRHDLVKDAPVQE